LQKARILHLFGHVLLPIERFRGIRIPVSIVQILPGHGNLLFDGLVVLSASPVANNDLSRVGNQGHVLVLCNSDNLHGVCRRFGGVHKVSHIHNVVSDVPRNDSRVRSGDSIPGLVGHPNPNRVSIVLKRNRDSSDRPCEGNIQPSVPTEGLGQLQGVNLLCHYSNSSSSSTTTTVDGSWVVVAVEGT